MHLMINICWLHKGDFMQIPDNSFLCCSLLSSTLSSSLSLLGLPEFSALPLHLKAFTGLRLPSASRAVAWKQSPGSKRGQPQGEPHLFSVFRFPGLPSFISWGWVPWKPFICFPISWLFQTGRQIWSLLLHLDWKRKSEEGNENELVKIWTWRRSVWKRQFCGPTIRKSSQWFSVTGRGNGGFGK